MTTLTVQPDGTVRFIYSDSLQPMLDLGKASIRRASHVEPTPDGQWDADMRPSGGPASLGPFRLRQEALDAETQWIQQRIEGP
jgi:hypothetical protein